MWMRNSILLLIAFLVHNTASSCISDQHINGCSVPFGQKFPYATRFKPACDRHDVCYRCGKVYNWSRASCDNAFLKDMLTICSNRYNGGNGSITNKMKFQLCKGAAKSYFKAVDLFGSKRYRQVILPWCTADPCVERNGRPSTTN